MTSKEIQKVLWQIKQMRILVELKRKKYDEVKDYHDTLSAVDCTKQRVAGGRTVSSVEKAFERVEGALQSYLKSCELLFDAEDLIQSRMEYLTADEKILVIQRFMEGVPMSKLYEKKHYSYDALYNKFNKIYKKMSDNEE